MRWAARLKKLQSTANVELTAAKLRFKRNFDQRVRPARINPRPVNRCYCGGTTLARTTAGNRLGWPAHD